MKREQIMDDWRLMERDLPFLIPYQNGRESVMVCVMVEHQSQPLELAMIVHFVFHTGLDAWTTSRNLDDLVVQPTQVRQSDWIRCDPIIWKLDDQSIDELVNSPKPFLQALGVIRATRESAARFREVFTSVMDRIGRLYATDHLRWHDLAWFVIHAGLVLKN